MQRRDNGAADQHAPAARNRRGEQKGDHQAENRVAHADGDRRRDPADRPIGAEHGDLAEGQIDPPDKPVDQRIGGREQRVYGRERDRVDELLHRIGGALRKLRQPFGRCGRRRLPLGLGQVEALEIEQLRLAKRALVGRHRHQIEPVTLERGAAETAGDEMHAACPARLARRVVDAHAGAGNRERDDPDFADLGPAGVQCGRNQPAQAKLLGIDRRTASSGEKRQQEHGEAQPMHGATIRQRPDFVPRIGLSPLRTSFIRLIFLKRLTRP